MDPNEEVFRQHDTTEVHEILGQVCEEFLEVRCLETGRPEYFYLKLSGMYHRFSLVAGCLRWRAPREPDPELDLAFDSYYVNRGEELAVLGAAVERAHMEDDRFDLAFTNGVKVVIRCHLTEDDDWMTVEVF